MGGLAVGAGLALGGLGALMGSRAASKEAQAQIDAAREQRAFDENQSSLGSLQKALLFYGPAGLDIWKRFTPKEQQDKILGTKGTPDTQLLAGQPNQSAEIDSQLSKFGITPQMAQELAKSGAGVGVLTLFTNGDRVQAQNIANLLTRRGVVQDVQGKDITVPGTPAQAGMLNEEDLKGFGPGLIAGYEDYANKSAADSSGALDRYNADTFSLDNQGRDLEAQASRFGRGQEARIRQDNADALTSANRAVQAALMSRGLGASSALTGAIGNNYRMATRDLNDSLGSLEDKQIGLRTSLGQQRLGTLGGRLSGRATIDQSNIDRNNQNRLGVLNTRMSTMDSLASGGNLIGKSQNYFPGVSPSGAAGSVLGQSLAGAGSLGLGYGLQSMLRQKPGAVDPFPYGAG